MEQPADEMLEQCRAMMAMMHEAGMGAMPSSDGMMGGMMSAGTGMLLSWLLWVTLVVAIGVMIVWLLVGRRRGVGHPDEARRTLDLRYARGELDRDTYLGMRADLGDRLPSAG